MHSQCECVKHICTVQQGLWKLQAEAGQARPHRYVIFCGDWGQCQARIPGINFVSKSLWELKKNLFNTYKYY